MASSTDAGPAVSLRGVSKHYGAIRAVDGVDLSVRRGELYGLIGHNGAGKSTLIKMMLGLTAPTAGEILVTGTSVRGHGFRAVRRRIGYLPENLVLYDNLSGNETLHFFARLKGADKASCPALLERLGLAGAAHRPVREYSKGMRQRLGFAQALLGAPQVLFLDEPTSGLDPAAIRDFYAVLQDLRAQGVTMLISSHILAELQDRVDRLAIISNGCLQAQGSVQTLREQLDLPLRMTLQLGPSSAAEVRQRLGALEGVALREQAGRLTVECPRAAKMVVLAALAPMATQMTDLHIHEPSLEDVFFGLEPDGLVSSPGTTDAGAGQSLARTLPVEL